MPNWQQTLNITDEYQKVENKEISTKEFATKVADSLVKLQPYPDPSIEKDRLFLARTSTFLSLQKTLSVDEVDDFLDNLYDWGDLELENGNKVCWIKTF